MPGPRPARPRIVRRGDLVAPVLLARQAAGAGGDDGRAPRTCAAPARRADQAHAEDGGRSRRATCTAGASRPATAEATERTRTRPSRQRNAHARQRPRRPRDRARGLAWHGPGTRRRRSTSPASTVSRWSSRIRAETLVADTLRDLPASADVTTLPDLGYRSIGDAATGFSTSSTSATSRRLVLDPTRPESLVYQVDGEAHAGVRHVHRQRRGRRPELESTSADR